MFHDPDSPVEINLNQTISYLNRRPTFLLEILRAVFHKEGPWPIAFSGRFWVPTPGSPRHRYISGDEIAAALVLEQCLIEKDGQNTNFFFLCFFLPIVL